MTRLVENGAQSEEKENPKGKPILNTIYVNFSQKGITFNPNLMTLNSQLQQFGISMTSKLYPQFHPRKE